jgi:hypothetical protein
MATLATFNKKCPLCQGFLSLSLLARLPTWPNSLSGHLHTRGQLQGPQLAPLRRSSILFADPGDQLAGMDHLPIRNFRSDRTDPQWIKLGSFS